MIILPRIITLLANRKTCDLSKTCLLLSLDSEYQAHNNKSTTQLLSSQWNLNASRCTRKLLQIKYLSSRTSARIMRLRRYKILMLSNLNHQRITPKTILRFFSQPILNREKRCQPAQALLLNRSQKQHRFKTLQLHPEPSLLRTCQCS